MDKLSSSQKEIVNLYVKIAKQSKSQPSFVDLAKEGISRDKVRHWFYNLSGLKSYVSKYFPKLKDIIEPETSESKNQLVKDYIDLANKNRAFPSKSQLIKIGISKDKIKHHFGSLTNLKEFVQKNHGNEIKNITEEILFSKEKMQELSADLKKYARFFITTVVGGAVLDVNFYNNVKLYCKINNAKLLLLICEDPAAVRKFTIPSELENESFITQDVLLNDNISISSIKLSAKQINPFFGLSRLGQKNNSFVYASPKQSLLLVPISNQKLPHAVMSTGSLTKPSYETDHYMSKRTERIAQNDHKMGGIIVEIQDKEIFFFRQVQADKKGSFVDLGKLYTKDGVRSVVPTEFILGDWHSGETDPIASAVWQEVIDLVKPEGLILHDTFNGRSINHHDKNKKVLRAQLFNQGYLSLEDELKQLASDLNYLSTKVDHVTVVRSNHDDFLDELLNDGRWIKDPINFSVCTRLAHAMVEGKSPLKHGLEIFGLTADNITFLERDQDYKKEGVQCGAHGDVGPNGSRGSLINLERSYGSCITGHSHVAGILRDCWAVGTSTSLRLSYNKGASSWIQASILLYPGGFRQIINCIDGKWKLDE